MENYPAIESCALEGFLMTWKVEMNKKDADLSKCGKLFWLETEKPRKRELEINNYLVKLFLWGHGLVILSLLHMYTEVDQWINKWCMVFSGFLTVELES